MGGESNVTCSDLLERNMIPLSVDFSYLILRNTLLLDSEGVSYPSMPTPDLPFDEFNPPVLVPASVAII